MSVLSQIDICFIVFCFDELVLQNNIFIKLIRLKLFSSNRNLLSDIYYPSSDINPFRRKKKKFRICLCQTNQYQTFKDGVLK